MDPARGMQACAETMEIVAARNVSSVDVTVARCFLLGGLTAFTELNNGGSIPD